MDSLFYKYLKIVNEDVIDIKPGGSAKLSNSMIFPVSYIPEEGNKQEKPVNFKIELDYDLFDEIKNGAGKIIEYRSKDKRAIAELKLKIQNSIKEYYTELKANGIRPVEFNKMKFNYIDFPASEDEKIVINDSPELKITKTQSGFDIKFIGVIKEVEK